ncbi:MAG: hypothetical protein KF764_22610 [Labilithrix sp.]|nr:hypothetical protein [Labilithrix sp.]MBX3223942.1 hypothetical protein [Labilithrix sp.]
MRAFETLVGLGVVLSVAGCTRGAPPAPEGIDATVSPLPGPTTADTSSVIDAATAAIADAGAPRATAALVDAGDPGSLPQTRDRPAASSPALDARAATLWDAIVHDDPERALPFFFPVSAYEQVKAIHSPASDWRRRLVAAYKRDIHGLHERLGNKAASAKLVRLDVPDERARWVEPDEEYNKLGYWRVYGTHIVYEADGKERTLDISSLISWRGEWYVVHLTGFK